MAFLIIAVVAAGLAVSILPSQQVGGKVTSSTSLSYSTPNPPSNSSASSSRQTTATVTTSELACGSEPPKSYSSPNITYAVPPCISYSFPSSRTQIRILDSPQVLPYVNGAYSYGVTYLKGNFTSTTQLILNVTGKLQVNGNWTTLYDISFTGNKLLNMTIQKSPSGLIVSAVRVDSLPDRHTSVAFTLQQQNIIRVALSNSSVRQLMTGPPYYVKIVYPDGRGLNVTNAVQLQQARGAMEINVRVNPSATAVVSASATYLGEVDCDSDMVCITDPLNVGPDAAVSLPPLQLKVVSTGRWSANLTVYNSTSADSRFLLFTKTLNGTGAGMFPIPWQGSSGRITIVASLTELDGESSWLWAAINWMGIEDLDVQGTSPDHTSVTVSSSVLA